MGVGKNSVLECAILFTSCVLEYFIMKVTVVRIFTPTKWKILVCGALFMMLYPIGIALRYRSTLLMEEGRVVGSVIIGILAFLSTPTAWIPMRLWSFEAALLVAFVWQIAYIYAITCLLVSGVAFLARSRTSPFVKSARIPPPAKGCVQSNGAIGIFWPTKEKIIWTIAVLVCSVSFFSIFAILLPQIAGTVFSDIVFTILYFGLSLAAFMATLFVPLFGDVVPFHVFFVVCISILLQILYVYGIVCTIVYFYHRRVKASKMSH